MAVEIHLSDPTADPDNCVDTREKLDRHLTSQRVRPGYLEKSIEIIDAPASAMHAGRRDPKQVRIPEHYLSMAADEIDLAIGSAKETLGDQLVILGHHYQRDEVIKHADFRGDSFKLSQLAASRPDSEFILFCGVHFMAETADILSASTQKVLLPNLEAGCSMADMADIDSVEECWEVLEDVCGEGTIPITYMNSAADLKAFCGRHGGIVCTSSNAQNILNWAFERGKRVLFFPDEHLGRNTGIKMDIPMEEMAIWDPRFPDRNDLDALTRAKIILWKGYCSVHARFNIEQIRDIRARDPAVNILVHPECRKEVVDASDYDGSTEYIVNLVTEAPPGSKWAIGTEINLVNRLSQENPDKTVFCLNPIVCPCSTMYRIHPAYVLWTLESLLSGDVINRISVPDDDAKHAIVALKRMLAHA
jgi:quinolinate synthase